MPCRSSWFLSDDDADTSPVSAPSVDAPQDYAPLLPQPLARRDFRGYFDRATVADLEQSRDSGAALDVALDPSAGSGAGGPAGSLLPPLLILAALFALS